MRKNINQNAGGLPGELHPRGSVREPAGYGTLLTLTDGPFDLRVPGVLDAYAEALEGWGGDE